MSLFSLTDVVRATERLFKLLFLHLLSGTTIIKKTRAQLCRMRKFL